MSSPSTARIALAALLFFAATSLGQAAQPKLGFAVQAEGEGFFLNPIVKRILVTDVLKGSIAEAAGMRKGDEILQIDGKNVIGRRALELWPLMKLNPGETRTLRLKHTDGTETDARITQPQT